MTRSTRRSGLLLVLLGILGTAFFWVTDPRYGPAGRRRPRGLVDWRNILFEIRGAPDNPIDAANTAQFSTMIGIAGCVLLLVIGFWLLSRRRV